MKLKFLFVVTLIHFSFQTFAQVSNWLWARQSFGNNGEWTGTMAFDSQGNVYLTGILRDTAVYGNDTLISHGNDDIILAKLDASGNWLWAKNVGGSYVDRGNCIIIDAADNLYVIGTFTSTVTFGNTT